MRTWFRATNLLAASLALGAVLSGCGTGPEIARDRRLAREIAGVWHLGGEKAPADIVFFPNGQCVVNSLHGPRGVQGLRGLWRSRDRDVLVIFEDGTALSLRKSRDGFRWARTPATSKRVTGDDSLLERVDGPETAWIGVWKLNPEPTGGYLYVSLHSDGAAYSSINGLAKGRWELRNGAARCQWPDGWRDRLEKTGNETIKRSWPPGADDQDSPADTYKALRVGADDLEFIP